MKKIAQYINGGCNVSVYEDGTKIRIGDSPDLPESIDLKITNFCDLACSFCHEDSTTIGTHADKKFIFEIMDQMQKGSEIAIGGGNPLSHPDIKEIAMYAKDLGLIPNITINALHFKNILPIRKLFYGVGISYNHAMRDDILKSCDSNMIHHFILGIHDPVYMFGMGKILLLGFKKYGRSENKTINLTNFNNFFPVICNSNKIVCFDNLALDQLNLNIKSDKRYMGDEGSYTMYIDAVKKQYSINSFNKNRLNFLSLKESFTNVQNSQKCFRDK